MFCLSRRKKYAYRIVLMIISYQERTVHSFGSMIRKVIMHAHVSGMVEKVKNEHEDDVLLVSIHIITYYNITTYNCSKIYIN